MDNMEQEIFTFHILKRMIDTEEISSDKLNIKNLVDYSISKFYTTDIMQTHLNLRVENPKVSKYIDENKKYDGHYDIILRDTTYWQEFSNMKIDKIESQKDKGCIIYFTRDIHDTNWILCEFNKGYEDKLTVGLLYPSLKYSDEVTTIWNDNHECESYPSYLFRDLFNKI